MLTKPLVFLMSIFSNISGITNIICLKRVTSTLLSCTAEWKAQIMSLKASYSGYGCSREYATELSIAEINYREIEEIIDE